MNEPNTLYVDVECREQIGKWMEDHGYTGEAAEVGCAFGGFAREVLADWKHCSRYHMIDPWWDQPKDVYREKTDDVNFEGRWRDVNRLASEDPRVQLIRALSVDGAKTIADNSLDFVHIDANHAYSFVLDDMDLWWPKLKPGGIFSGDDYYNDTIYPNFNEVKRAVDRWMAEHRLTFTVCRRPAWWCVKPGTTA